jgi:hypothetical protein
MKGVSQVRKLILWELAQSVGYALGIKDFIK